MIIQHEDDGRKGVFYIEENGDTVAEMVYKWSGAGQMIIEHTEVDEKLEGKGIGRQLVEKGVAFAREKHRKIIPQCAFAKSVMDKTPEYQDVLN